MLDAADPLHLIGTMIADRYRVVSQLGAGAMSAVYEVEDTSSGRRCALKVLRSDLADNAVVAARLVREGKAMGMFAHPHIVQLLDAGVLHQRPYIVTELVTGISLRAMIDAGQLDPARALRMVRQVLEALDHAHRHGVIHRDIKPENIMLVDGGRPGYDEDLVKVLDFGIAKLVDDTRAFLDEATLTRTGFEVLGTPMYAAPESLLGGPIDARTDLYSLGVVLFELLAGRPPFDAADPVVVPRLHATTKTPTLAERAPERVFTPELEYVVAEALAKRPERRFASAADMIALVDAARASIEAPRGDTLIGNANAIAMQPIASRTARWSRGRPALAAFGSFPRRRQVAIVGIGLVAIAVLGVATASLGSPHAVAAPLEAHVDAKPAASQDATALVARGDRELSRGLSLDAVADYERALARAPQLAGDAQIRANLVTVATGTDAPAAIVALELLATRVRPAARDEIAAQASQGKISDVRQRALAIAERDGFVDAVDRLGSYVLDLTDAKSCDTRRAAIDKLRALSDRRAIGALRRARDRFTCVRDAATDALAYLEANP